MGLFSPPSFFFFSLKDARVAGFKPSKTTNITLYDVQSSCFMKCVLTRYSNFELSALSERAVNRPLLSSGECDFQSVEHSQICFFLEHVSADYLRVVVGSLADAFLALSFVDPKFAALFAQVVFVMHRVEDEAVKGQSAGRTVNVRVQF